MHWLQKRSLPIPALTIADPALVAAYRFWSSKREDDFLPPRCVIDTPGFRLIVPGALWLGRGAYCGRLQPFLDATRAEADAMRLEDALRIDLDHAFDTGIPTLQLLELKIKERSILYQQLLLPTADDGYKVNELLEISSIGALRLVRSSAKAA